MTGSEKAPNSSIEGFKLCPHTQEAWTEEDNTDEETHATADPYLPDDPMSAEERMVDTGEASGFADGEHEMGFMSIIRDNWERRKRQKQMSAKDLWKLLQGKWHGVDGRKRPQWHEIKEDSGVLTCTSWTVNQRARSPTWPERRITKIKVEDDGNVLWGVGAVKLDIANATGEKIVWKNPRGTDWYWSRGWLRH